MNVPILPIARRLLPTRKAAPAAPPRLTRMAAWAVPPRTVAANDARFPSPAGPGLRGAYARASGFQARFQVR